MEDNGEPVVVEPLGPLVFTLEHARRGIEEVEFERAARSAWRGKASIRADYGRRF